MKYITSVRGKTFEIEINQNGHIMVNGVDRTVDIQSLREPLYSALIDNQSFEALVEEHDGLLHVILQGDLYEVNVVDERERRLAAASSGFKAAQGEIVIRSPMPGMIVAVSVSNGQAVTAGQPLLILESMKMENQIKAPRAGVVEHLQVAAGERVEQNRPLLTLLAGVETADPGPSSTGQA